MKYIFSIIDFNINKSPSPSLWQQEQYSLATMLPESHQVSRQGVPENHTYFELSYLKKRIVH